MSFISSLRRQNLTGALIVVLAATIAGCGFQPMHGQRSNASATTLATIDIGLIADRTGQILRNELLQEMQPQGPARQQPYLLTVTLAEYLRDLAIKRNEAATRANLTLVASFVVSQGSNGLLIHSGSARSVNAYNILTSDFATLSARENARKRGARQLALEIKERISVWLVQTGRAPRSR
jgi:LPS-assembly lipoprotein